MTKRKASEMKESQPIDTTLGLNEIDIYSLGRDVLMEIFGFLECDHLIELSNTCKMLKGIICKLPLWKTQLRYYGNPKSDEPFNSYKIAKRRSMRYSDLIGCQESKMETTILLQNNVMGNFKSDHLVLTTSGDSFTIRCQETLKETKTLYLQGKMDNHVKIIRCDKDSSMFF